MLVVRDRRVSLGARRAAAPGASAPSTSCAGAAGFVLAKLDLANHAASNLVARMASISGSLVTREARAYASVTSSPIV